MDQRPGLSHSEVQALSLYLQALVCSRAGRVQQFSSLLKDLEADGGVTVTFTPDKKAVKVCALRHLFLLRRLAL